MIDCLDFVDMLYTVCRDQRDILQTIGFDGSFIEVGLGDFYQMFNLYESNNWKPMNFNLQEHDDDDGADNIDGTLVVERFRQRRPFSLGGEATVLCNGFVI